MDIFDVLALVGGLCLFLFGMDIMGKALERRAGSSLRTLLSRLTTRRLLGFLTGLGVTAIIQSSSATTVMVVGFVNSGLMNLGQAINVIIGANIGTTVTAWLLSLAGIDSGNLFIQLLKPSSFTPILALIGMAMLLFSKKQKKHDTAHILLGFATLMFGMDAMSDAVKGLSEVEAFRQLFITFENPILGVLVGAVLTAIIQSSSASVGILQALAATGQVSYGAAIPIIMGQNIGTCITAIISCTGANKNAKRAAIVHLCFNIIGTAVCLILFCIVKYVFTPGILTEEATYLGIAICHTGFNVICTSLLLPASSLLEKLACRLIPDAKQPEARVELDERLLLTPTIALEQSSSLTVEMAQSARTALTGSLAALRQYTPVLAQEVRDQEERSDRYEDILGSYLVKLSSQSLSPESSAEAGKLLRIIGDFERISDHAVNILRTTEELREKKLSFSPQAEAELTVMSDAVTEVLDLAITAFTRNDLRAAAQVEPLEQCIDGLKEQLRVRHIQRLQRGECSIVTGFIWSDLLTDLERTADHCSNIAGCVIDTAHNNLNLHETLRAVRRGNEAYEDAYEEYARQYSLPA